VGLAVEGQRRPSRPSLSEEQRRTEALLAAAVAIECVRLGGFNNSMAIAGYCAMVLDNCRARTADDLRRYLPLLRGHLLWLRSLPTGSPLTLTRR
jgi:hypothetical protein